MVYTKASFEIKARPPAMGRAEGETHLSWLTTIFMAFFHIDAVAAFFCSRTN